MLTLLRPLVIVVAAALLTARALPVRAISYNELVFGDLSSDPAMPDVYELSHSVIDPQLLTASFGGGDIDVLKLIVPAYHTVEEITLISYSGATQSFAGLQNGAVWTAGTGGTINPASLLGWTHFGPAAAGAGVAEDILDNMGVPKNGSAGFTPPLGPGVYTMLLQDTGGVVDYQIQFNVLYSLKPVGDFNGDFFVNGADLPNWRGDYRVDDGSDADGDGDSDGADFLIWQRNVNKVFSASAVPEPSALVLAACGVLAAARARCRRSRA